MQKTQIGSKPLETNYGCFILQQETFQWQSKVVTENTSCDWFSVKPTELKNEAKKPQSLMCPLESGS